MADRRTIERSGKAQGGLALPLICTPLVGRTRAAVLAEVESILPKRPDLIEWRVDHYQGIGRSEEVVALGRQLRVRAGDTPIIFTRRSTREGGQPIPIGEAEVAALQEAVCRAGVVDYLDQELASGPEEMRRAREISRPAGVGLIASFHDFQRTPPADEILAKLAAAQAAEADVAKVAVTPSGPEDVLELLSATLRGRRALGLPLITVAMGAHGALSRLFGFAFGSSVTFAVGESSSAPGQLPIETLRLVHQVLLSSLGGVGP